MADDSAHRELAEIELLRHENERLKQQAREAHDTLVLACAELGWATDGRLPTAVRHAVEMIRRLSDGQEVSGLAKSA